MKFEEKKDLTIYIEGFEQFDKYVKKINQSYTQNYEIHHGYLINYSKYTELRERIKEEYENSFNHFNVKIPMNNNSKKDYTIEEIAFRDSNYLLNMILNGNKYILINENLYQLLCKEEYKNRASLEYEINYYKIRFNFDGQYPLIFLNSKNIYMKKKCQTFYHTKVIIIIFRMIYILV